MTNYRTVTNARNSVSNIYESRATLVANFLLRARLHFVLLG